MPPLLPDPSISGDTDEPMVAFEPSTLAAIITAAFNAGASCGLHPGGPATALLDLMRRDYVGAALDELLAPRTCRDTGTGGGT